jgi:hypothetical protein
MLKTDKCTHPDLREMTFSDGAVIQGCPAMLAVRDGERILWREQCTHGDTYRHAILGWKTRGGELE